MDYSVSLVADVCGARNYEVRWGDHILRGQDIRLPGDKNLVFLGCRRGYMMCRLLNVEVSDVLHHATATFSTACVETMLTARCLAVSRAAAELGAQPGMTCGELIEILDRPE